MTINLSHWISEYKAQNPDDEVEYFDRQGTRKTDRYEFQTISTDIQQKGYLRRDEFRNICKWKYSPNDYLYKQNSQHQVERWTGKAIQVKQSIAEKIDALTELDGVGVPVASAILAVVFPDDFATMDYRAFRTLPWVSSTDILGNYDVFSSYFEAYRNYHTSPESYEFYLHEVRKIANSSNLIAREVDMALWAYDKEKNP